MFLHPNKATFSIAGLYYYDNTVFNNVVVPESVNKNQLVENIVLECAELELLYPDANFLKKALETWSKTELPTWEHIAKLSELDYNPIENYDRYESEVENGARGENTSRNSFVGTESKGNATGNTRTADTSDTIDKVAGFNTETLSTNASTHGEATGTNSSNSDTNTKSNSVETGNENRKATDNRIRSSRIHGNIGVTTVAQMMEGELETYPKINIIDYITDSFKNRFCILVY